MSKIILKLWHLWKGHVYESDDESQFNTKKRDNLFKCECGSKMFI